MKTAPHPPRERAVVPIVRLCELIEELDDALDAVMSRACPLLDPAAGTHNLREAQQLAVDALEAVRRLRDALPESTT